MSIFDPIYIDREIDTKLKSLVLNRLNKDKFDELSSHSSDEIWFIQDSELSGQPIVVDTTPRPTKLSEFQNDVPYLSSVSWNDINNRPTIPSYTSQLTNDSGYATSAYVDEQISHSITWRDWYIVDWKYDGITFAAREANSTVSMEKVGSAPSISLEYTTDCMTWQDFIVGTTTVVLPSAGDKVNIRAKTTNSATASEYDAYNRFAFTGTVDARGDILSLLNKDASAVQSMPTRCFGRLFDQATGLVDASQLVFPTFTSDLCYDAMFGGCTTMVYPPALPSKSLSSYCYDYMFSNCRSLVKSPDLPSTSVSGRSHCYNYMFNGCSSLVEIKLSWTGNFLKTYFDHWVDGVAATGTFYYNGSSTSRGVSAIPSGWTIQSF